MVRGKDLVKRGNESTDETFCISWELRLKFQVAGSCLGGRYLVSSSCDCFDPHGGETVASLKRFGPGLADRILSMNFF